LSEAIKKIYAISPRPKLGNKQNKGKSGGCILSPGRIYEIKRISEDQGCILFKRRISNKKDIRGPRLYSY
jgi:hypothetical protein